MTPDILAHWPMWASLVGKVPRPAVIQQLGAVRIKASALETMVDGAWRDAIQQESLEPISQPELSGGFEGLLDAFKPGEAVTITLEADVAPTPKLKSTKGLKASFEPVAYDAAKVDEMLEDSRKQLATVGPVEGRAAEQGDIAVLGFKGTYSDDGSEIEGGSADSMDVDLEHGRMIPGFIEGVIGGSGGLRVRLPRRDAGANSSSATGGQGRCHRLQQRQDSGAHRATAGATLRRWLG